MKRLLLAALGLCFSAFAFAQSAPAKAPPVALKGTDPITYFNPGKPAKGASGIAYDFDDARYLFSSAKNKELFAANPDKYAPQFTGLCATGLGMGMKAEADPNIFAVQDGKLYVFSSAEARDMVQKDPTLLRKAHQTWSKDHPGK
jgi:YHS domain-containing protein